MHYIVLNDISPKYIASNRKRPTVFEGKKVDVVNELSGWWLL
jgi:hypothetical protein